MGDAETRLREHLAANDVLFGELRALPYTKAAAFAVTDRAGRAMPALVAGDRVWLDPTPGLDVLGEMLAAYDLLGRRDLGADDVIFLVTSFGVIPPEIAGFGSYRQTRSVPGYPAQLVYEEGGARLELVVPRTAGRRGATATPSQPVYQARLVISPAYAIHWFLEAAEVPVRPEP